MRSVIFFGPIVLASCKNKTRKMHLCSEVTHMETLKTIGIVGFLFFLIKGLLWLLLFALVAKGFVSKERLEGIKERLRSPFKDR